MWIADKWKDYEVIDTSSGEKLERWGDYILVRPDPQVIWNTDKNDSRWKNITDITTAVIRAGANGNFLTFLNNGPLITGNWNLTSSLFLLNIQGFFLSRL